MLVTIILNTVVVKLDVSHRLITKNHHRGLALLKVAKSAQFIVLPSDFK